MLNYTTYPDGELVERLQNDDQAAFEELYNRFAPDLYLSVQRKIKDAAVAQEIVHDVFLNLWKIRESLQIMHIKAYLQRAVQLRLINYVTRVRPPAFFDLLHSMLHSPYEADQTLLTKDVLQLLETWIETLPEKRKKIFIKHYFQQYTTQEIAAEMGIPHKTVQNNLTISLQYLRARFGHLLFLLIFIR